MANVVNISEMFQICKKKRRNADLILLAEVLGISQSAAQSQFRRGVERAVIAMYAIIEEREQMLSRLKEKFCTNA